MPYLPFKHYNYLMYFYFLINWLTPGIGNFSVFLLLIYTDFSFINIITGKVNEEFSHFYVIFKMQLHYRLQSEINCDVYLQQVSDNCKIFVKTNMVRAQYIHVFQIFSSLC